MERITLNNQPQPFFLISHHYRECHVKSEKNDDMKDESEESNEGQESWPHTFEVNMSKGETRFQANLLSKEDGR